FNTLEGHGLGKLLVGFALSAARKDADAFARCIKAAVEAS
ncbi:SRPBCC family protein, partial [Streptomyces sp. NPDC054841]